MATTTNESNKHHARVLALAEVEDDGGESDRPIAEEYSELVVAVRANRAAEAARLADMRRDGSVGGGARRGDDATGVTGGGGGGGSGGEDFAVVAAEDDDAKAFLALVTPPGSVVKAPTSLPTSASGLPETTPGGTVKPRPPNQSRENRRVRQFRSASEITQEELASCFHLPSEAACRKLGIGLTVLKRQCRKFGIKRWPFRKMKSLDRLITNVQAGISPGDQNKLLVKSVEELEEQKRRMEECQVLDLDDTTKRLQQAYSKANHKARRNRSEASKIRAAASSMAIRELEARGRKKKSPTNQEDAYGLLSLAGVLSGGGEYGDEEIMDDDDEQSGSRGGASGVSSGVKCDEHGVEIKQEINTNALPSNVVGVVGAASAPILATKSPLGNKTKESVASDKKPARGSAGASASKTSNAMVSRGTYYANAEEFEVEEKVLTAVKGAWSPARPAARKSDAEDTVEAFLSPVNKRKAPVGRPSKADDDTKRAKPYTGAKRGRKKKNASEDDDPLASLAAAALGLKAPSTRGVGRPRKHPLIAPKAASVGGAGASAKDSKESSARGAAPTTTTTKDTAASSAAVDAAAATTTSAKDADDTSEDHPAFAVPVVKGARTARSRLNPVDHSFYKRHIEERMAELREQLVGRKSDTGGVDLDIHAETSKLVEELETLNAPTSKR